MYPNNYELPITLYLVELCDGSTMYILGDSLLNQLDGPYLVLDEQEITANSQVFTIVVTERKPLFAMRFEQYEPNGNIKELRWKITSRAPKYYQYSYDPLNRLTSANYGFLELPANATPGQGPQAVASEEFSVPGIGYDAVGNIKSITRKGLVFDGSCFVPREIDRLTMLYNGERPNQMSNVKDEAPIDSRVYGFKPGASFTALYQYDDNGNLTFDPHKSLTMQYNFLNLPTSIGAMSLTYDATGRKWKKDGEFGAVLYDGGIEYRDGQLEAINLPDGRLVAEYNGGQITRFRAEYFHEDHLGNTRLGFSDFNQNGYIELTEEDPGTPENELEITQEAHYYPFGMGHKGPWYATVAPENKYLYNGKELNEDYGINLMDYGARWYDAAIGRWNVTDPLAEDYYPFSPYNYTLNNPVLLIDPDGMRVSIVGDKEYRNQVFNALINLALSSNAGAELVNNAFSSKRTLVIGNTMSEIENQLDEWNTEERGYATLAFDLDQATADLDASNGRNGRTLAQTVETSLAHELAHFSSSQTGYLLDANGYRSEIAAEEVYAVEMENRVRKEMRLAERTHYGGMNVHSKEAVESQKYPGFYTLRNKTNYAPTGSGAKLNTPLNNSESPLRDYRFTPTNVLRRALKKPLPKKEWIISN